MAKELLRRFLIGSTLLLMAATLGVATWSNQLQAQARIGFMAAPIHPTTAPSEP